MSNCFDTDKPCGCLDTATEAVVIVPDCGCTSSNICLESLTDKLVAGTYSIVGTGCDKKIRLSPGDTPIDISVKVNSTDTASGYLDDKIDNGIYVKKTIVDDNGEKSIKLDIAIDDLISADEDNALEKGVDGKLLLVAPPSSIQVVRACFDNTWRNVTTVYSATTRVVQNSGQLKYRIRYDGTIELKGNINYTVQFGAYATDNRKVTINAGRVPVDCLSSTEIDGSSELKSIIYIDIPQGSNIPQQYGYLIKRVGQNITIDFQSSFINETTRTVVVDFDNIASYTNI